MPGEHHTPPASNFEDVQRHLVVLGSGFAVNAVCQDDHLGGQLLTTRQLNLSTCQSTSFVHHLPVTLSPPQYFCSRIQF